jgi:hypothetical protein
LYCTDLRCSIFFRFPGHDYRQPAPAKHVPARSEADAAQIKAMEEEEFIEVELALAEENLPEAVISTPEMEDESYEVEVVVDFSLPETSTAPLHRENALHIHYQAEEKYDHVNGKTAPISTEEVPESMSEVSNNWAEDRFEEMTAEEKQV